MKKLSPREEEVLKLVVAEYTTAEIASILGLSMRTIDSHRSNIGRKIGSNSLLALVKYAIAQGWIEGIAHQNIPNPKS
jgi:DNA-binding CsgD family transcriptional regulator